MTFIKRVLYLFFSENKSVREFLGGKWVRHKIPGAEWVTWNGILETHCGWPLNPDEYESEDHPGKTLRHVWWESL